MLNKLLSACLSVVLAATSALALIPAVVVYDPVSNTTRIVEAAAQIAKWAEQLREMREAYEQFDRFSEYRKVIDGKWKDALQKVLRDYAGEALEGTPSLTGLGWKVEDLRRPTSARNALENLRRVMDGAPLGDSKKVRDGLDIIYGEAPQTSEGLSVEQAHREIAVAIKSSGNLRLAIGEKQGNIERLRKQVEAGGLTPGDVERQRAQLATEEAEVGLLTAAAIDNSNRLQAASLGLQAHAQTNAELQRLRERTRRLSMMGGVNFGLTTAAAPREVE